MAACRCCRIISRLTNTGMSINISLRNATAPGVLFRAFLIAQRITCMDVDSASSTAACASSIE